MVSPPSRAIMRNAEPLQKPEKREWLAQHATRVQVLAALIAGQKFEIPLNFLSRSGPLLCHQKEDREPRPASS